MSRSYFRGRGWLSRWSGTFYGDGVECWNGEERGGEQAEVVM